MPKGKGKETIKAVMGEFKRGKLRSGSGQKVTNKKQAIAIAIHESKPVNAFDEAKKKKQTNVPSSKSVPKGSMVAQLRRGR